MHKETTYLVVAAADRGVPEAQAFGSAASVVTLRPLDVSGARSGPDEHISREDLALAVGKHERQRPRWVWNRTQDWYPELLSQDATVSRCHDLALCSAILAGSAFTAGTAYARDRPASADEDGPDISPVRAGWPANPDQAALFDSPVPPASPSADGLSLELAAQLEALSLADEPGRLALLLAAESAGALAAAEMQHIGVPWSAELHERILNEQLGPRPPAGARPGKLEALANRLRASLGAPGLNPDSPSELIRALHRAGLEVKTTRTWELQQHHHAVVEPLLQYKKLSRLYSANGWAWLDTWVHDGRFRPEYVVGGVVSGRWASRGGGALQIPRQVRSAVHADPGWKLVVADAAQLEPRVLVALSQDERMAAAARGKDLYAGLAEQGFGGDRSKAKGALLGAIYGATTGESGRLLPELSRSYPRAVGFVEAAARAGRNGEIVTTRLGRSCPRPSDRWLAMQRSTTAEEQRRADSSARSRGRFTRNFVVQGSAADWASCWIAELRRRLRLAADTRQTAAHLVFFLHDEVMVHAPESLVPLVVKAVQESAAAAKELLFGRIPVEFPVTVAVVDSYDEAK